MREIDWINTEQKIHIATYQNHQELQGNTKAKNQKLGKY